MSSTNRLSTKKLDDLTQHDMNNFYATIESLQVQFVTTLNNQKSPGHNVVSKIIKYWVPNEKNIVLLQEYISALPDNPNKFDQAIIDWVLDNKIYKMF